MSAIRLCHQLNGIIQLMDLKASYQVINDLFCWFSFSAEISGEMPGGARNIFSGRRNTVNLVNNSRVLRIVTIAISC